MKRLKDEIKAKSEQIELLEKQISNSVIVSDKMDQSGVSQVHSIYIIVVLFHLLVVQLNAGCFIQKTVAELMAQLNEKSFELEVRIIYVLLILSYIQQVLLWNIWEVKSFFFNP